MLLILSYLVSLTSEALGMIFKSISLKTGWNFEYSIIESSEKGVCSHG